MGYYYYWGKLDYDRALQELALARERQPNNADLYMATAAVQRRQGRWPECGCKFREGGAAEPAIDRRDRQPGRDLQSGPQV